MKGVLREWLWANLMCGRQVHSLPRPPPLGMWQGMATGACHVTACPTDPGDVYTNNKLGHLLGTIRKDYDGAERHYRAALKTGQ